MRVRVILVIFLILSAGSFLRLFDLDRSPPSLNWDEASQGYNAYSILKTGRDEYGNWFPIFIRSFDDYKGGVTTYLTIPFIAFLGINQVSVRLVSAFAGILSIVLIYLISIKLFSNGKKSELIGFASAFLFSISPYSIFFSRVLFEPNVGLTIFLSGFLAYLNRQKKGMLILSVLLFILAMYTYHSYKVLIPILSFIFWRIEKNNLNRFNFSTRNVFFIAIILIFLLPLVINIYSGITQARLQSTNILKYWPPPLWQLLRQSQTRFFDINKYFLFFWEIAGRYLAYFSPMNLFIRESFEPGLKIPTLAIFYPFEFVFWLIGLLAVFNNYSKYKYLIWLILISPIPAVITWNWFQAHRVLPLFAMFTIINGFGVCLSFNFIWDKLNKFDFRSILISGLVFGMVCFGLWNAFYLFDNLLVLLPMNYSGYWQPGFKQPIPRIAKIQDAYDQVIIDTAQAQPYIFTLFYMSYPPQKYLREVDLQKLSQGRRRDYDFGKIKFRKIYWPKDRFLKKTLFMGDKFSLPEKDIKNTLNAKIIKDYNEREGDVRIVTLE